MPENMSIGLLVAIVAGIALIGVICAQVLRRKPDRVPAKYERELAHSLLTERVRRYQNILIYLPDHYLPRDLKLMLVLGLLNTIEQLRKLGYDEENDKLQNKLDSARDMLAQLNVDNEQAEIRPITRPDKAKEAREILDSVRSFILYMTEQKQMDVSRTDEYLTLVDHLKAQTHLDLIDHAAGKAEADGDYDQAIDMLREAIEELSPRMSDEYYVDKIAVYNDRINKLTVKRSEEASSILG